ncbi:chain A decameric ring structure of Kshv (hhv-8) latency-associated nuclearf antigen (lana) DNA binding domain [Harp seal herpesvirus]|uniref:Chain A decameric ring structure of Kshv (Hhv-8) latency-associated nuclearf antigen (Lana) DNA binding domain n=1 Tax=phocid gammaherpesvirus 3 TaxID=2560643 RepID=A0A0R5X8N4_9GAMA|nr:chain A decameric ring structure of Kshv (hhv-8) latency-associated nuclearf antigen (lana) DNA binding domain [Harp seal herpesvirus]AJG42999.1 chain A decameric ring structure of Kshv (hhv-8) latency-associated nuclearf antigen (lana) DNA binding domain [Harp seal herpesvirus]
MYLKRMLGTYADWIPGVPWMAGLFVWCYNPDVLTRLQAAIQFPGIVAGSLGAIPGTAFDPTPTPTNYTLTVFCQTKEQARALEVALRGYSARRADSPPLRTSLTTYQTPLPFPIIPPHSRQ